MEFYVTLKVNDPKTGELLEAVQGFFGCDCCETPEEFVEEHGADIGEFLENRLEYDYNGTGAVARLDFTLLEDYSEEDDEDD